MNSNQDRINRKALFEDTGLLSQVELDKIAELRQKLDKSFLKIALDYGLLSRYNYQKTLDTYYTEKYQFNFDALEVYSTFEKCETNLIFFLNALVFPMKDANGDLNLVVADPSDSNNIKRIEEELELECTKIYVADELDILKILHLIYGGDILESAIFKLYNNDPNSSAIETFQLKQIISIGIIGFLIVFVFFLSPIDTIVGSNLLLNLFLLLSISFKFLLTITGSKTELEHKVTDKEIKAINNDDLPIYSILLPVFKESEVIYKLAWNLKSLDYPLEKLDVKLLVESNDDVTINALKQMKFPAIFEPILIPDALPKTKPKACNYGLHFCKGKYLTIYDAEDIPDPDQLKKVFVLFQKLPSAYIAVQCALNYYNKNENFLTKMFTLEYSYWFDYMLPGLDKLDIPIPLGGTSNHFKFDKLIELGGWDGFNVTEDADLGIRAYAKDYKITILDSTTYEEANNHFFNWIRQRSRWIKGYMQTYLVHMRDPKKLYKTLGTKGFFGFQFFIGGTIFTFLSYPILLILLIVCLFIPNEFINLFFPDWVLVLSVISFFAGNLMMIYINMIAVFKRRSYSLLLYALLNPIYWIMHSISAYKGLIQLITKPFYWEKTQHGLSKVIKK